MELYNKQSIMDLLTMTPHYWHINKQQKEQLMQLEGLVCNLEMRLSVIHLENKAKQR